LYQGGAGDFATEPVRNSTGVYSWHGGVFGVSTGAQACDTVAVLETIDVAVGADNRPADFVARDCGFRWRPSTGARMAKPKSVSEKLTLGDCWEGKWSREGQSRGNEHVDVVYTTEIILDKYLAVVRFRNKEVGLVL